MASRADDSNDASSDTTASYKPTFHRPAGTSNDPNPITTPDSDGHSAPDPEFVPERQHTRTDVAHTRNAALWTGLVVGAVVLVVLLAFIM